MFTSRSFTTPFSRLDEALGQQLSADHFILCAGLSGNGKTILAGQLATHFALAGANVLFVSTEVDYPDLFKRIMSASASIPFERISNQLKVIVLPLGEQGSLQMPDPDAYGMEAASKALQVCLALNKHLAFARIESLGFDPQNKFGELLNRYQVEKGCMPDAVVFDYLDYPETTRAELDVFKMRRAVDEAALAFHATAREHNLLFIAFCQADPGLSQSKKITPSAIWEFKQIAKHADAFIGVSHKLKSADSPSCETGLYERVQYLSVFTKKPPSTVMVPVERAFEYQRFEVYRQRPRSATVEEVGSDEYRAQVIEKESEFPGYVLARRKKLYDAFGCGVPYDINLYAFLLLTAKSKGTCAGKSSYSRETLAKYLGLSIKRLRTRLPGGGPRRHRRRCAHRRWRPCGR